MSAPVPLGYAESGDCSEREKDPTQNKMTRDPGDACAEERQDAEQNKVARFSVHSRPRMEASAHPTFRLYSFQEVANGVMDREEAAGAVWRPRSLVAWPASGCRARGRAVLSSDSRQQTGV
jgi:hypothetical protein